MKSSILTLIAALSCASAFTSPSNTKKYVENTRETKTHLFMSIPNPLDTLTSGLASIVRLPNGVTVDPNVKTNPDIRLLRLYDVENSRACRSVRERITELDLVVEKVIPSTPNSRAITDADYKYALPPGATVPCLMISQTGAEPTILSGMAVILSFLEENFSTGTTTTSSTTKEDVDLVQQVSEALQTAGSYIANFMRPGRGMAVSPASASLKGINRPDERPLILYSYEGNQFCRLVREVLTELDLVYELRSAGKESPRRQELAAKTGGSSQCPYIIDENTGTAMAESADIIQYLYDTYALWTPPNELLEWVSDSVMVQFKPIFAKLAPIQAGSNQENTDAYQNDLRNAIAEIEAETSSYPVVVYTYDLSPFASEAKSLLTRLNIEFKEISLGKEWFPGLVAPNGAIKRAALLEMTGQSSLPHIFVGGSPIGGLFSGNPGLIPSLGEGKFLEMVAQAKEGKQVTSKL